MMSASSRISRELVSDDLLDELLPAALTTVRQVAEERAARVEPGTSARTSTAAL
jgi:hypothetical protein